jgi:hypothetical protein
LLLHRSSPDCRSSGEPIGHSGKRSPRGQDAQLRGHWANFACCFSACVTHCSPPSASPSVWACSSGRSTPSRHTMSRPLPPSFICAVGPFLSKPSTISAPARYRSLPDPRTCGGPLGQKGRQVRFHKAPSWLWKFLHRLGGKGQVIGVPTIEVERLGLARRE